MSSIKRVRQQLPPITREEAEAKEAGYNQSRHHPPVVPPTTKRYLRVRGLWEEFLQYIHDDKPCLQHQEDLPTAGRLKLFMEWVFNSSTGILTEHVTLNTLRNTWFCFRSMYERATDKGIPRDLGKDVLNFIKTELREKGLAMVRRQKALADALDVGWLLTFLWCYDKHEFRHPRYRVQLSLVILLIVYTGARPGSIIESSAYRGSNQAMCYKDFELIGLPTGPENTLELILKVRFRYEKGRRDQGGNDRQEYKWVALREDRTCRGRCPVTYFLNLAFADDAFADLTGARDTKYLKFPGFNKCIHLRFKESKLDTLLFRHCNLDGTISPDIAMNYDETARATIELGLRIGFRDALKPYNLRRGAANAFDGDTGVSQNQYSQLLGHSVKMMGESYISNISGVDVQGIINHETLRQDHIQLLRSMRLHLNPNAPSQLPFEQTMAVLDDSELVELDAHLKFLEEKLKLEESLELRQEYTETTWIRKRRFAQFYQRARIEFRDKSFEMADSNMIRKMIQNGLDSEKGIITKDFDKKAFEVPSLKFVSSIHFPHRYRVANGLWTQSPRPDSLPDTDLLESLEHFSNPAAYTYYYYGEAPVDGRCSMCKKEMVKVPRSERTRHIHGCAESLHRQKTKKDFELSHLKYCEWGKCKAAFTKKFTFLSKDFANDVSDPVQRRQRRAKESKRLHDLRRNEKPSISHNAEPQSRKSIAGHLKCHLKNGQTICLWNSCGIQCSSEKDLHRHLWNLHGVSLKQAPFEPQFCFEHSDRGWFTDEFDWEDHCELHTKTPRHNLNLVQHGQMFTAGLQCPFCLQDTEKPFSKRFTQFTSRGTFNLHMAAHEKSYRDQFPLRCPVPSCSDDLFSIYLELQIHFFDAHDLKPKGFTRSHGFGSKSGSVDESEDENELDKDFSDLEIGLQSEDDANDWSETIDGDSGSEDGISIKRKFADC